MTARQILDKETLVPIGVIVAICGCLFGCFLWLDARFDSGDIERIRMGTTIEMNAVEMKRAHNDFSAKLDRQSTILAEKIAERTDDRWRASDMRAWAWKLQEAIRDQISAEGATRFKLPDPATFSEPDRTNGFTEERPR